MLMELVIAIDLLELDALLLNLERAPRRWGALPSAQQSTFVGLVSSKHSTYSTPHDGAVVETFSYSVLMTNSDFAAEILRHIR